MTEPLGLDDGAGEHIDGVPRWSGRDERTGEGDPDEAVVLAAAEPLRFDQGILREGDGVVVPPGQTGRFGARNDQADRPEELVEALRTLERIGEIGIVRSAAPTSSAMRSAYRRSSRALIAAGGNPESFASSSPSSLCARAAARSPVSRRAPARMFIARP